MTLFNFPRVSRRSKPVVATNLPLDAWYYRSHSQSPRFVQKVEMCTALCSGDGAWDASAGQNHYHTLLRVFLVPTRNDPCGSADTLLIERVLSTDGAYHSVTPIAETFSADGPPFRPDVHDRVCAVSRGPAKAFAHQLVVERTLVFRYGLLSLAELAQILAFISRSTKSICDDDDCIFQSRAFAFTSLAALAPRLPPRRAGERHSGSASTEYGLEMASDSVFELSAEALLGQVRRLSRDSASAQVLELIGALKCQPGASAKASLYH